MSKIVTPGTKVIVKENVTLDIVKTIATTLQGHILLGYDKKNNNAYVIKITSKDLHEKNAAKIESQTIIKVKENIIQEASIMNYLQTKKPPKGL